MAIDSDAIFRAYVDFANTATNVIWARNSAMLVANSFLIIPLTSKVRSNLQRWIAVGGILVCILWLIMTLEGWRYYYEMHKYIAAAAPAGTFQFPQGFGRDIIFLCTVALIFVFVAIYVYWLSVHLRAPIAATTTSRRPSSVFETDG